MLNKQRQKEGKEQVFIRIYVNSKRSEISTKFYVNSIDWNKQTQKVKISDSNYHLINTYIDDIKNKITKQYLKFIALEEDITVIKLKNCFLGKEEDEKPNHKTIMEAFNYHNLKIAETIKVGKVCEKTLDRYKITQSKIQSRR